MNFFKEKFLFYFEVFYLNFFFILLISILFNTIGLLDSYNPDDNARSSVSLFKYDEKNSEHLLSLKDIETLKGNNVENLYYFSTEYVNADLNGSKVNLKVAFISDVFFNLFDKRNSAPLLDVGELLVSRKIANKYFREENGFDKQTIQIKEKGYIVKDIIPNFKSDFLDHDLYFSIKELKDIVYSDFTLSEEQLDYFIKNQSVLRVYLDNTELNKIESLFSPNIELSDTSNTSDIYSQANLNKHKLDKINSFHISKSVFEKIETSVSLLIIFNLMILSVMIVNYVYFLLSQIVFFERNLNIYELLGAQYSFLYMIVLKRNIISASIALIFAIIALPFLFDFIMSLPPFSLKGFKLSVFSNYETFLSLFLSILLILAMPFIIVQLTKGRFHILKSKYRSESLNSRKRRQAIFSIQTALFILCIYVLFEMLAYNEQKMNFDLGYSVENNTYTKLSPNNWNDFKWDTSSEELRRENIRQYFEGSKRKQGISFVNSHFLDPRVEQWAFETQNGSVVARVYFVEREFFDLLKIRPLHGQVLFDEASVAVINKAFWERVGDIEKAVGSSLSFQMYGQSKTVLVEAVVENLFMPYVDYENTPVILIPFSNYLGPSLNFISDSSYSQTLIDELNKELEFRIEMVSSKSYLDRLFQVERNLAYFLSVILALLMSIYLLGLMALLRFYLNENKGSLKMLSILGGNSVDLFLHGITRILGTNSTLILFFLLFLFWFIGFTQLQELSILLFSITIAITYTIIASITYLWTRKGL